MRVLLVYYTGTYNTRFLTDRLEAHLRPLDDAERAEILSDFEEHFAAGAESGKTEEEICAELGNPYTCAQAYLQTDAPAARTQTPAQPVFTAPIVAKAEKPAEKEGKWQRTLWAVFFLSMKPTLYIGAKMILSVLKPSIL